MPDRKWLDGARFPEHAPVIRAMESKYSDGGITLMVPVTEAVRGDQHVNLSADDARALAYDLLARADHINPTIEHDTDRAWLESVRSIGNGLTDVRAARLCAYMDRLGHEWRAMRKRLDEAERYAAGTDRRIGNLAASVARAVRNGGSLADVVAAINALPDVAGEPAVALGQAPTPHRRAS